ncbi:MAG: hypothetical protein FWG12_00415 [Holophagaceae bacterium]|nr:hypothetical protein [Holophagaceae bacterium]
MVYRLIVSVLVYAAFAVPMLSQTDMESALTRHKGNKIVLLGEWSPGNRSQWADVLNSDGIFEHGFELLERSSFFPRGIADIGIRNLDAFERWLRQRYALASTAKWAALDMENMLIVAGIQTPDAKEFDRMLEQRGMRSPLRKTRDFLRENSDHIDAKTDLLKEVRRRALHVMPSSQDEDLGDEADLRTWAVLASEVDRVFGGSWLGIEIDFFKAEENQPERFSKLMRGVFQKHISSVESALKIEPTEPGLWNIWAWMARSLPSYVWKNFVDSFEVFTDIELSPPVPSPETCVWLIQESMAKGYWETVVNLAKTARRFTQRGLIVKSEWTPGREGIISAIEAPKAIEGYPTKSAYAPHLEALLRLGRVDEANGIFDEMIRVLGKTSTGEYMSNNALVAAGAARAAGMEEIAKIWELGEQVDKVPYIKPIGVGGAGILLMAYCDDPFGAGLNYFRSIQALGGKLSPIVAALPIPKKEDVDTAGWKKDGEDRWALLDGTGVVIAQGREAPELGYLQAIIDRLGRKSPAEIRQRLIDENGPVPGLELSMAFGRVSASDPAEAEAAVRTMNMVLAEHPEILIHLPRVLMPRGVQQSPSPPESPTRQLAGRLLASIESLLERKPSAENLWYQWLYWRGIVGGERRVGPLVKRLKLSPLTQPGTVPPSFMMDRLLEECRADGNWTEAIELLKTAWDRDFERANNPDDIALFVRLPYKDIVGDHIGMHLIEAYLQDSKPREADGIFNAVLNVGGKFKDVSKIVALAKEKGHERLAREWEEKVKN